MSEKESQDIIDKISSQKSEDSSDVAIDSNDMPPNSIPINRERKKARSNDLKEDSEYVIINSTKTRIKRCYLSADPKELPYICRGINKAEIKLSLAEFKSQVLVRDFGQLKSGIQAFHDKKIDSKKSILSSHTDKIVEVTEYLFLNKEEIYEPQNVTDRSDFMKVLHEYLLVLDQEAVDSINEAANNSELPGQNASEYAKISAEIEGVKELVKIFDLASIPEDYLNCSYAEVMRLLSSNKEILEGFKFEMKSLNQYNEEDSKEKEVKERIIDSFFNNNIYYLDVTRLWIIRNEELISEFSQSQLGSDFRKNIRDYMDVFHYIVQSDIKFKKYRKDIDYKNLRTYYFIELKY